MKFDPSKIKIHGNGFAIYLLDEKGDFRLHVWDYRIPRQSVDSSIHNHRLSFRSRVLAGALLNTIYLLDRYHPVSTHVLYFPSPHNDPAGNNLLVSSDLLVRAEAVSSEYVHCGQEYVLKAGAFRSSHFFGTTVSLLRKTAVTDTPVQVLVPCGELPDNEFDRVKQAIPLWLCDVYEEYLPKAVSVVHSLLGANRAYMFFRQDDDGKEFFYPVEIPPGTLQDNIDLNPGTIRVVRVLDNAVVWEKPEH